MTRKDYNRIAAALTNSRPSEIEELHVWEHTARFIADALAQDNPRFDTESFLQASGVGS